MTTLDDSTVTEATELRSFPSHVYEGAGEFCAAYLQESAQTAVSIDVAALERAATVLLNAYRCGSTVFSCGNGGSAAIANHLQCDHLKGVRTDTDLVPRVVSLSSNVELITAISNDIDYRDIFSYQLQSQSRPGDVLVVISSSGRSPNIVRAIEWARNHRVRTIALTGFDGGDARRLADVVIHVNYANYGIVEDLHQAAMHAIAQFIRQSQMDRDLISLTRF